MEKVVQTLNRLGVSYRSYARLEEESFGSEVYLVQTPEDEKILKFSHNQGKFWREIRTLEFLNSSLPVPKVISTVPPEPRMNGAILMERIPGRALSHHLITEEVATSCGELLGLLHSVEIKGLGCFGKDGFETFPFRTWWEYRQDLVLGSWTKVIETAIDQELLKNCISVLNGFYKNIASSELCLIHCDYRPGNLLMDRSVTGLIDFESARTGDAAYDFIKFYEIIGQGPAWPCFLEGYSKFKKLPDLQNLLPYYEFELSYGFLYWATVRSDQALFQKRLARLKELLKHFDS